ncbi:MAG: YncE family protein [Verrucomicrobiales bacterium]
MSRLIVLIALFATATLTRVCGAEKEVVLFSYFTLSEGGIERMVIDTTTGELLERGSIYNDPAAILIQQLQLTEQQDYVVGIHPRDEDPCVVIVDLRTPDYPARRIAFPARPDGHAVLDHHTYVADNSGVISKIELTTATIVDRLDLRNSTEPKGHQPDQITVLPDKKHLAVVIGDDGPSHQRRGSRVAILSQDLEIVHDVLLPLDHPELHFTNEGGRQRGPVPRRLLANEPINRAALVLELYGSVLLCDLDALVQHGRLENVVSLSTHKDGQFGQTFPGWARWLSFEDKTYLLVSNSSEEGGVCLIDPIAGTIVDHAETGKGQLFPPHILSDGTSLLATRDGVTRRRGETQVEAEHVELKELVRLSFQVENRQLNAEIIPFSKHPYELYPLGGKDRFLTLLMEEQGAQKVLTHGIWDQTERRMLWEIPSPGVYRNAVTLRGPGAGPYQSPGP